MALPEVQMSPGQGQFTLCMNNGEWQGLLLNWRIYALPIGNQIQIKNNRALAEQKMSVSSWMLTLCSGHDAHFLINSSQ